MIDRFVKELIERLEEEVNDAKCRWDDDEYYVGQANAYEHTISIVNQLAEEYNNGWIPCSERFPEEWVDVLVTTINGEVYRACYTGYNFDDCETEYFHSLYVVAWQPLPAPYKPKEDNENA